MPKSIKATFSFGKNWMNYVANAVDENTIEESKRSLLEYFSEEDFKGKTFIDVGCGSGLFSLAALLLGCGHVVSFDKDQFSLKAAKLIENKFYDAMPSHSKWDIFEGSILQDEIVSSLNNKGDIVYSWGVLHHTGDMWNAIGNCAKLVKDDGYFLLSIYNHASTSPFWKKIKEFYNKYTIIQPFLFAVCGAGGTLLCMMKNRTWRLRRKRGMNVFYDVIDWLGGYPYEFAPFSEIRNFLEKRGFKLIKAPTMLSSGKNKAISLYDIITARDTACNEFMFKKLSHR